MSKDLINKKLIRHLAGLVKLRLGDEVDELTDDLKEIVDHFNELEEVDTEGIEPVSGGTELINVMREDSYNDEDCLSKDEAIKSFPEEKDGYLKTPSILNHE
ncbi:MAG TPA: Asp-tRNA(Asn)/Glu-tRNA(Gln) amidotransferase subunit GatC [Candidatus Paceibacterota bacterium]|nr:Asp-tRNA(Asn)/Glu-tRNA(Gln) amidotransferase subunit GatC [Candidatus Paceibacterota bacterium]